MEKTLFPFVSIVGQEDMKRALILNIIDPTIGGVLIKGEKGTAKSTTVRSLARILPEVDVVKDCRFNCDPNRPEAYCSECSDRIASDEQLGSETRNMRVVELPLSATEDRVSGTLDIEHILKTGERRFEPGVLAQANGNLLYIDEVNLLDDHIVDLLLDSAAMGVNYVEREGVSFSHPSRFVLVGTMNPEEGDLRPQLLDRFGLSVDVKGDRDPAIRKEVVKRRIAFENDPKGYTESCADESEDLRESIMFARKHLKEVRVDDEIYDAIVNITSHFEIDGHRADITLIRAAKANAAFHRRAMVIKNDIRDVAHLVLAHRMRRRPFEESVLDEEELESCLNGM